jgi:beta-glucosidase
VGERALRETYLRAFEHVVRDAAPTMVMCSYNAINGVLASENRWLLTDVLRDEWGFSGLVVSDWGAVRDRVAALRAGVDLEMPPTGTDDDVVNAVRASELDEVILDSVADRLANLERRIGPTRQPFGQAQLGDLQQSNRDIALEAALEGAVLLKNDGVLPLDARAYGAPGSVALVGELARTPRFQGGGSSRVVPTASVSLLDALTARLGEAVDFAPGYTVDESGPADELTDKAVSVARAADVVVVALGLPGDAESEGFDRDDLDLPAEQIALLRRISQVSDRVVVVMSNGGVVSVAEWQEQADALLEGWLLGQEGGEALARLLLGEAAPSGRLAETVPYRLSDHPSYLSFPGSGGTVLYGEGNYVGYRGFEATGRAVAYPFGFGLTYTTFEYADLSVTAVEDAWDVTFTVINSGDRDGAEVAQLYLSSPRGHGTADTARLAGFEKVWISAGQAITVRIRLTDADLAYWDDVSHDWAVAAGTHHLRVGASVADIRLTGTIEHRGYRALTQLTERSTIAEWLADPAGREVLEPLIAKVRAGVGAGASPEIVRMFTAMPLDKLRSFGQGVSREMLAGLVDQAHTRQNELIAAGQARRPRRGIEKAEVQA